MPNVNTVHLLGTLARDPETRYKPSGASITSFALAINNRYTTGSGEKREEVTFVEIDAWAKLGEVIYPFRQLRTVYHVRNRARSLRVDCAMHASRSNSRTNLMSDQITITGGSIPQDSRSSSVLAMIDRVTQGNLTSEGVAVLRELSALMKDMRQDEARVTFAAAFADLQASIDGVTARKIVPNNDGGARYVYAPYEEIMETVKPKLKQFGFSVSFDTRFIGEGSEARAQVTCKLMHRDGHEKSCEWAGRVGQGPPKSTPCQSDGAATTYAQRFALCKMLNIVIETDDDARAYGSAISPEQATELRRRVESAGGDVKRFLDHAKASSFEEIASGKYAMLDSALRAKEAAKAKEVK